MKELKNRLELAKYFADLGYVEGAEIGVLGGSYSEVLCQVNPNLKLYCIDSWGRDGGKLADYHMRKYEEARKRLEPYKTKLMRMNSMEAVEQFKNESLDFVYIDANHSFDAIMRDLIEWTMRVRKSGIIAGHDYADGPRVGVKDAVDTYVKHHFLRLHLTEQADSHGVSWWFKKRWNI